MNKQTCYYTSISFAFLFLVQFECIRGGWQCHLDAQSVEMFADRRKGLNLSQEELLDEVPRKARKLCII